MDAVGIDTSEPSQDDEPVESPVGICRVCLHGNLMMRDLFGDSEVVSLSSKAMSFASVKMMPGDGLPGQVCCDCAEKLDSTYEFKLQVEQADNVLRERYDNLHIKEELFFNEVEVHLESDRHEDVSEMDVDVQYDPDALAVPSPSSHKSSSLLKDHLALLEVAKLAEQDLNPHSPLIQEALGSSARESLQESLQAPEDYLHESSDPASHQILITRHVGSVKTENLSTGEITIDEHNYIVQQGYTLSNEQEHVLMQQNNVHVPQHFPTLMLEDEDPEEVEAAEDDGNHHELEEQGHELHAIQDQDLEHVGQDQDLEHVDQDQDLDHVGQDQDLQHVDQDQDLEHVPQDQDPEHVTHDELENDTHEHELELEDEHLNLTIEQESIEPPQESIQSPQPSTVIPEPPIKRPRKSSEMNSDEENYFENLNLSSRLKQFTEEKSVFFACYLCDRQFVSKEPLKEHMHSHAEVRQTLSLKKTPEKSQKTPPQSVKSQPSGKKANKCPYCGKEYLYVISFNKHIKQHEKNDDDVKQEHQEDSDSDGFDNTETFDMIQDDRPESPESTNSDHFSTSPMKIEGDVAIYPCTKCHEKFPSKTDLQRHNLHHNQSEGERCNICSLEFESLEKLKDHRSTHVIEGVLTEQDLRDELSNVCTKEYDKSVSKLDPDDKDLKCPNCSMTFMSKKLLIKHMVSHERTKYRCKLCTQEFTKKDHLRKHAEQHSRVKSFKCTQCAKVFGNELTLRNHLIATNHKTILQGEEYDPNKRIKRVAAKAAQKIIDKIKTEDGLEDSEGDDTDDFGDSPRMREKLSKRGTRRDLECATCGKRCSSKQYLLRHMELHAKDEKPELTQSKPKQSDLSLRTCGVGFDRDLDDNSDDDFESGLDWPSDTHECTTCKKRYSTKKSLLRHQLLHEEPNFECDICNVKFYRKDKLKAHYDKCSEKNPDQVRKCNICGDTFENNEILKEHRLKHVDEGILTEEDLRELEPGSDDRKSGEKIARKRRIDIVGLECTECNKQYTSRKGLLRHIQVHEGKKYLCDICPKKFYRREHLKIHVAKHNMVKPYKCSRCSKRFIKEEQLAAHLTKHERTFKKSKEADSTSKRFLCEICSKSFTQSTTLVAHLRAHNGIKPYVCEVCARPFTTNAYLKMHMRTHTQERPYSCQYCERAFARADTLANHLTSHTGEAKYHCKYCPKNFRRLKSLKEHVFIHTGQRPYACPTCDRRFNNNGSRYAHSKRCKQNLLQGQGRQGQSQNVQVQLQQEIHGVVLDNGQNVQQVQVQQVQGIQQVQQIQQIQQIQQVQIQQNQGQTIRLAQAVGPTMQVVQSKNIKTITITRQPDQVGHQVMQHQELLMPLILPLTVTLTDVDEEVILPEGTKIFTTS